MLLSNLQSMRPKSGKWDTNEPRDSPFDTFLPPCYRLRRVALKNIKERFDHQTGGLSHCSLNFDCLSSTINRKKDSQANILFSPPQSSLSNGFVVKYEAPLWGTRGTHLSAVFGDLTELAPLFPLVCSLFLFLTCMLLPLP